MRDPASIHKVKNDPSEKNQFKIAPINTCTYKCSHTHVNLFIHRNAYHSSICVKDKVKPNSITCVVSMKYLITPLVLEHFDFMHSLYGSLPPALPCIEKLDTRGGHLAENQESLG